MSHRSVKDSDENLDLFSSNSRPHGSSLVPLKAGRHSLQVDKVAKTGVDDLMPEKHAHDLIVAPTGNEARSVLAARKITAPKVRSVSTGRATTKGESNPFSRLTRSNSATATLPTVSTPHTISFPTVRSSSSSKKTTSASASALSHKSPPSLPLNSALSVTRSSTPSIVRTPSPSSTPPSRIHSRSAIPLVGKTRSAPNSRSSTPISRPPGTAHLAAIHPRSPTQAAESVTSGSSGGRLPSSGRRSVSGSRATSAGRSFSSHDSPPQIPPRLEARASTPRLRATITTKGTTTRGRDSEHASDRKDLKKASSGVSGTASGKSASADSSRCGRTISKISLQTAIRHTDIQNGKVGRRPFSSTTLYPHSLRSSSAFKAQSGSQQVAENREKCIGQDNGRSLEESDRSGSARFDALLLGNDVKDTNWLLSIDGEPSSDSEQSLLFYNGFEPPPEPFPPL